LCLSPSIQGDEKIIFIAFAKVKLPSCTVFIFSFHSPSQNVQRLCVLSTVPAEGDSFVGPTCLTMPFSPQTPERSCFSNSPVPVVAFTAAGFAPMPMGCNLSYAGAAAGSVSAACVGETTRAGGRKKVSRRFFPTLQKRKRINLPFSNFKDNAKRVQTGDGQREFHPLTD
jgi:hypothetical protein